MSRNPENSIVLSPKADRRYKHGHVRRDKNGDLIGHPDTVTIKRMEMPESAPEWMKMNPPMIVSDELAELLEINA